VAQGVTVVFSPLISLIQDQLAQLHQLDITAGAFNSAMSFDQSRSMWG
jgi:superfamily II DNA helicase RecQ